MFGLGMQELIIILIIIMIVFGAGKLPQIGSGIGKGIHNFKKSVREPSEETASRKEKNAQLMVEKVTVRRHSVL